ncbi:MAG: AMP-binding protein [Pseudomonadota bacterium]
MPARTQTIDAWLKTHAAHQPDKPALHQDGKTWSYSTLEAWVGEMAAGLAGRLGLKRGDRVAYLGYNAAEEVALFFAAARLGLMVVPLNWRLEAAEQRYMIEIAAPRVIFHGAEFAQQAHDIAPPETRVCAEIPLAEPSNEASAAEITDPFLLVFTSATTGRPKGVVHTQEAVLWNALSSLHLHELTSRDHVLVMLPLFHVGGINIQMMPCFFAGGTVSLMSRFEPGRALDMLNRDGITLSVVVPTVMQALFAHPDWEGAALPHLRMLSIGSTDVPVDILRRVSERGIAIVQVYGATETGPISTYQRADEATQTMGSIGRPAAHSSVRLVGSGGTDCDVDEPGEIWVRGANCFDSYWRDPDATQSAVEDGWFKTGDVAYRDRNGLYWFVGRLKHVIISGGENIFPAEIERILATLPGVDEVAVVGRADPKWGEVPVIVAVVTPGGPDRDTLLHACHGQIARFKQPKDVVFTETLPRNALGKVRLEAVREIAAAGETYAG